jgi:predicted O-methyltransferase YrrM
MSSLHDSRVSRVLDHLYAEAERIDPDLLSRAEGKDPAERDVLLDKAFIPVSRDAGRFLYALVRGSRPGQILEFGTSFGISTIYMAAAARDGGAGKLITTERHEGKATQATEYLRDAGLLDWVDVRIGDALQTLTDQKSGVSVVFLDGWKDLYLPVLQLLEPALVPGALVTADDLDLFPGVLKTYLDYVRNPVNGYVSVTVPIGDAMELSTRSK